MNDDDRLIFAAVGPLAAMGLGVSLIPLRGLTVPSNFTFAFLALTIVVAEFGGRIPAIATASVSALSLDFFLTRPYLRLAMHEKNDLVAFVGLAACGLLAAFLGTPRRERHGMRRRADLLHRALLLVESGGPAGARVRQVAEAAVAALPLAAVFVRDNAGLLVGGFGKPSLEAMVPADVMSPTTLSAARAAVLEWRGQVPPLAEKGVRLPLIAGARCRGWLDLWAGGRPSARAEWQTAVALAGVLAAILQAAESRLEDQDVPSWTVGRRPAF